MAVSYEELKSVLLRVKEESERAGLKQNIKKTKITASSPITSWQIDWEKVEAVTDFLILGSEITVDGNCSHEIRRWLLLGRKTMTNLVSVLKSRDITLPTEVDIVKTIVFPMVTCGCERWTEKKAEHLQTVVLEKTPESPLDGKKIKPVNLKRNQPWILTGRADAVAETSILIIWWEQLTHWKSPWCWERLRAEGQEGIIGWVDWMASPMQWTWTWANFRRWWGTERLACCHLWGSKESDMTRWLSNNNNVRTTKSLEDKMGWNWGNDRSWRLGT